MKRRLLLVVLSIMLLFTSIAVYATEGTQVDIYDENKDLVKSVVFVIGMNEYFVNGEIPGVKMDAVPFETEGRTFVPIRYLGYALGVDPEDVEWDGKARKATLTKGENSVELIIGSKTMKNNNKTRVMDVAPILKNGRTYLPARFVAEGLGYQVDWTPPNIVLAYPKGAEKPDISNVKDYISKVVKEEPEPIKEVTKSNFNDLPRPSVIATITGKDVGLGKLIGGDPNHHFVKAHDEAKVSIITKDQLPYRVGATAILDIKEDKNATDKTWAEGKLIVTVVEGGVGPSADLFLWADKYYNRGAMFAAEKYVKTNVRTKLTDIAEKTIKIEDVKYFGFIAGIENTNDNEILLVENPEYKGDK